MASTSVDVPAQIADSPEEQYEDDSEDVLVDYFEKSASAVRRSFEWFEQDIGLPAFDYIYDSFQRRPIRTTFVAFYVALSILPVLSFVGFSVFILATLIFVALMVAILVSACAIAFFGFWLACLLIFLLFVSFNLTLSAIATYLLAQFALRAHEEGPLVALSGLAQETRDKLTRSDSEDEEGDHMVAGPSSDILNEALGEKLSSAPSGEVKTEAMP